MQLAITAASVLAGLLILVAFILYNRDEGKINTGTWLILALGDALDFSSYFEMTGHDLVKNLVPICFAVGSITTFLYAFGKGRFSRPDWIDTTVVVLDLSIMVAWVYLNVFDSTTANLAYQATTILAFVPMYRGLARGTEKETVTPWALWTGAFVLFLLSHGLGTGPWEEGVYPLVGLITHAIVLGFAIRLWASKHGI